MASISEHHQSTPQHIAIIMDGNRRWAKAHNLPVLEGHRRVVDAILEPLIEHASNRGVKYLTFWAWSTENWRRQEEEVTGIMQIFRHVIARKWQKLHKNGVQIRIIGNITQFDPDLRTSLEKVVEETKHNQKITTVFALNYGGRDEIKRAMEQWKEHPSTNVEEYLDTAGIPDPELIVRTGGEQRLSGFLLWQSEYSELYFPSWFMPDFTPEKFDECLAEYAQRKRNFGK
jgi:undecaprenyl diphosphate synthase